MKEVNIYTYQGDCVKLNKPYSASSLRLIALNKFYDLYIAIKMYHVMLSCVLPNKLS